MEVGAIIEFASRAMLKMPWWSMLNEEGALLKLVRGRCPNCLVIDTDLAGGSILTCKEGDAQTAG